MRLEVLECQAEKDIGDSLEHLEQREKQENPVNGVLMEPLDQLDQPVLSVQEECQAREDPMESPVLRDNVEVTVILVRQALQVNLDLQDHLDSLESLESRVKLDRLDLRELSVKPAPRDNQVNLELMEKLEDRVVWVHLEVLERKEHGVNLAYKAHLAFPDQWDPLASQEPWALWVQREKRVPLVFRDFRVREEPKEAPDHRANGESLV